MRKIVMIFAVMLVTVSAFGQFTIHEVNQLKISDNSNGIGYFSKGTNLTNGWASLPGVLAITYDKRDFVIGGWNKAGVWRGASFFIDANTSNIGIGTTTPSGLLHMKMISNSTNDGLTLESNNGSSVWKIHAEEAISGSWGNRALLFYNNTTGKYVMTIGAGGNVGIGAMNPKYTLSVRGKIGADEIIVEDVNQWADFVFAKDYKLMPLSEVESFITENNHLPDVPSEQDVKENGINVAEMNAKLLQKVEELTLYVIEINKENKKLREEVEELKRKSISMK